MKEWKTVRSIGEFGHQVVIGAFAPVVEDVFPTRTYFGLVQDATYVYGSFRDRDGHLFTIMRQVRPEISLPAILQTNLEGGELIPHPTKGIGYMGQVNQRIESGVHIAEGGGVSKGFSIERTLDGVRWVEGDYLTVEGATVGPGIQWHDPGREFAGLYLSHIQHAKGTILGGEVEGFFGWDQFYCPAGRSWHSSPYLERLEVAWFTLANKYDDGSFEVGQICFGQENWDFALICNEKGPIVMTKDVKAQIEFGENGFPEVVHYLIDGEPWNWVGAKNATMPFYARRPPIYRPRDGICQKVGDRRKVVCGFGWIDTFADGRGGMGCSLQQPQGKQS